MGERNAETFKEKIEMLLKTGEFDFLKDVTQDKLWKLVFSVLYIHAQEDNNLHVKAEWKPHIYDGIFWANYCSECNTYLPQGMDWTPNYCPQCGAQMDVTI